MTALPETTIAAIRALRATGRSRPEVATTLGVSLSSVDRYSTAPPSPAGVGTEGCRNGLSAGVSVPQQVAYGDYTLTPGVIDDDAIDAFTCDYCGVLAARIIDERDWDLWWLTDPDEVAPDAPFDAAYTLHFAAADPDGMALDIHGPAPVQELAEDWGAQARRLEGTELARVLGYLRGAGRPPGAEIDATTEAFAQLLLSEYDRFTANRI